MKKPFAYITAVWKGGEFTVIDQAAVYCRKVYEAGFTPICPVLYLPHFLRDSIPAEHKDGIDIGRELLRRSHVLIRKKRYCCGAAAGHYRHYPGWHSENPCSGRKRGGGLMPDDLYRLTLFLLHRLVVPP